MADESKYVALEVMYSMPGKPKKSKVLKTEKAFDTFAAKLEERGGSIEAYRIADGADKGMSL